MEIVLVGKYTSLHDSYMSVIKSLEHAALRCHRKLVLKWVEAGDLEPNAEKDNPVRYHEAWQSLCSAKGILVPGGFGQRGTEGMISAAKWAREKKVPYLGICLGFQIAVIEYARNICGITNANSAELDPETKDPVVVYMPEISKTHLGGTMRLGLRPTIFQKGTEEWSRIRKLYGGEEVVWERHRHRYEINPKIIERIEQGNPDPASKANKFARPPPERAPSLPEIAFGQPKDQAPHSGPPADELYFVGRDERGERMQIAEMKDHPYFVGLQAHPELVSRPLNPSPPFLGLVAAAAGLLEQQILEQRAFQPPHPKEVMILESEARRRQETGEPIDLVEKPAKTPPGLSTPIRGRSPERAATNGAAQ